MYTHELYIYILNIFDNSKYGLGVYWKNVILNFKINRNFIVDPAYNIIK